MKENKVIEKAHAIREEFLKSINPPEVNHRKWLDDTQNMRVVALNEAMGYAKSVLANKNTIVDADDVLQVAEQFAHFLIDGKR